MVESKEQTALIQSLASTIQDKIIMPAEENTAGLQSELALTNEKVAALEKNLTELQKSLRKTQIGATFLTALVALIITQALFFF